MRKSRKLYYYNLKQILCDAINNYELGTFMFGCVIGCLFVTLLHIVLC
jgi:hypothetical protein